MIDLAGLAARFWSKVNVFVEGDGCWEWTAATMPNGYGVFGVGGRRYLAHRVAKALATGCAVPGGKWVLHRCDNRPCVRPDHLYIGTRADNVRDAIERCRYATGDRNGTRLHSDRVRRGSDHGLRLHPERIARGERQGSSRLSAERVIQIRREAARGGRSQREIGLAAGVSQTQVSQIVRRKAWAHVDG